MSKLTGWKLTFDVSHESFSGHTHQDGQHTVTVYNVKNRAGAIKKALAELKKSSPSYDYRLVSYSQLQ